MPFKHNAARRHRVPEARYRIRNWRGYEAGPKRRGDPTLWVDEAAKAGWQAPRRTTPGGQAWYSDAAVELVLVLRLGFHLALRQAEGFARSVLRSLGQELRVPDLTTLSRRSRGFVGRRPNTVPHGPMHLVVDSTGLKLFGCGEWDAEKHGRARRSWRERHIAVDAGTGEIVASVLTADGADDAGEAPILLEQTEGEFASVTADGAYDGEPAYHAVAGRQPGAPPDLVIPPRASAVASTEDAGAQSQHDRHIRLIAEKGRMAWQRATGYGRRSHAETAVGRYKLLIGPKLRARGLPAQRGETAIAAEVLNRMIRVAKPVSVRVA